MSNKKFKIKEDKFCLVYMDKNNQMTKFTCDKAVYHQVLINLLTRGVTLFIQCEDKKTTDQHHASLYWS